MNKFIIGGLLFVGVVFYYQSGNDATTMNESQVKVAKTDKSSDLEVITVVDKTSVNIATKKVKVSKATVAKAKTNIIQNEPSKVVKQQSLPQLYKTNKPRATYQGMQISRKNQAIQMQRAKKMHQQRIAQRQQMLKRHQMQQKAIAMRTIQRQKIQSQRVEQLNFRYKSQMEQHKLRNMSKMKPQES